MGKMGITLLAGLLLSAIAAFLMYIQRKDLKDQNKMNRKVILLISLAILVATAPVLLISSNVGEKIAKKYLTSESVMVLETVNLLPFSGSFGAYIVTGKNNGKKVAWYLQEEELVEESYNDIVDRNMIVFTNATAPTKQLVKVNVGSFWKWFAFIPKTHRFVIPAGGLQEGKVVKNYKFIPVSE